MATLDPIWGLAVPPRGALPPDIPTSALETFFGASKPPRAGGDGGIPSPELQPVPGHDGYFWYAPGTAIYDAEGRYVPSEVFEGSSASPVPPAPAASASATSTMPMILPVPPGPQSYLFMPEEYLGYAPEGIRQNASDEMQAWLRSLGYAGTGVYGRYGETNFARPGGPGTIYFSPDTFEAIFDPTIRGWLRYLFGERGYSTRVPYPVS